MNSDDNFVYTNEENRSSKKGVQKEKQRVKKSWKLQSFYKSSTELPAGLDDQHGRLIQLRKNEYTCKVFPSKVGENGNPMWTCVCEQWSFSIELKSETWDVSDRVKMQVSGEHLSNCKNLRKDGKKKLL